MTKNIPKVRAWRVTLLNDERYLVWAPTKFLAKPNFWNHYNGGMLLHSPHIKTIGRCTSADDRPVPKSLVEGI